MHYGRFISRLHNSMINSGWAVRFVMAQAVTAVLCFALLSLFTPHLISASLVVHIGSSALPITWDSSVFLSCYHFLTLFSPVPQDSSANISRPSHLQTPLELIPPPIHPAHLSACPLPSPVPLTLVNHNKSPLTFCNYCVCFTTTLTRLVLFILLFKTALALFSRWLKRWCNNPFFKRCSCDSAGQYFPLTVVRMFLISAQFL